MSYQTGTLIRLPKPVLGFRDIAVWILKGLRVIG